MIKALKEKYEGILHVMPIETLEQRKQKELVKMFVGDLSDIIRRIEDA